MKKKNVLLIKHVIPHIHIEKQTLLSYFSLSLQLLTSRTNFDNIINIC
jgi:hypothetical protein